MIQLKTYRFVLYKSLLLSTIAQTDHADHSLFTHVNIGVGTVEGAAPHYFVGGQNSIWPPNNLSELTHILLVKSFALVQR